jgi:type II secretory pathway pseudopilin PulG
MGNMGWIELLIVIGIIGIVLAAIVAFGMRRR